MSTSKQRIHLSIEFADAILPVIQCDDGHDRVPLKPIVNEIGVEWRRQQKKVAEGTYLHKRLGVTVEVLKYRNKPMICIRLDRVEAFLNTLNPQNIRGMGNVEPANWLEAKHAEWDDALHAYETQGVAVKSNTNAQVELVLKLIKNKQAATPRDRRVLDHLLLQQLKQLDVPANLLTDPQTRLPFGEQA